MFKKWCIEQNFYKKPNVSHVFMDRGSISVPFDRLNEFNHKYIEAVRSGEKLFVVEQKTPTYNFFVDIDYKDDQALTIEEIRDICKIICDKVKRHGGKKCLVSVSQPKPSGEYIKTGVHLNWPDYVVNQASALALRQHILVALSKAKGGPDWNAVIDSSVYGDLTRKTKGSGLRMPWSHKISKGVVEGAYLPLFIYENGPLSALRRIEQYPDIDILKMAIVRTERTDFVTVEHPSVSVKEGAFTDAQTKDELHDEEVKEMVQDFIQKNMEGQGSAIVTKMFRHKNTYLVSTTSKYCENLKREHGSNHVWFYISGRVIAQKCFCRCETIRERRDGFCKDFYGRRHELHSKIIDKLYEDRSELSSCPVMKKIEENPEIKQVDVKPQLQSYMRRFMEGQGDTTVINLKRNKSEYFVTTTSNYCETIKGNHEEATMNYIINKNKITQKCPVCKKQKPKTHILSASVVTNLYSSQKK
jgi:hypothetical protein